MVAAGRKDVPIMLGCVWVGSSCLSIDPYVPYPTRVSDFRSSA